MFLCCAQQPVLPTRGETQMPEQGLWRYSSIETFLCFFLCLKTWVFFGMAHLGGISARQDVTSEQFLGFKVLLVPKFYSFQHKRQLGHYLIHHFKHLLTGHYTISLMAHYAVYPICFWLYTHRANTVYWCIVWSCFFLP